MENSVFPAHIKYVDGKKIIQTVGAHCQETAEYAAEALAGVGLSKTAYLAGLLHDCGKFTNKYRNYIEAAASGEKVRRGSVNHTFAGVRYILDCYHDEQAHRIEDFSSEVIAYAVGAHHGLFDCIDEDGKNGFSYRQTKNDINYEEAIGNFLKVVSKDEIDSLFQDCVKEINTIVQRFAIFCCKEEEACFAYGELCRLDLSAVIEDDMRRRSTEEAFAYGELCRLVLSAVIEGDRRSTAEFMNGDLLVEHYRHISKDEWKKIYYKVTEEIHQLETKTPLQKARCQLSDMCAISAEKPSGIYRLNLPTGGGKTLASLRYALRHAARLDDKQRIFFVMPLLAIIEQNAKEIRKYVRDENIILEHHSNVVNEDEQLTDEELSEKELLIDTWDAPIIVTTLVQMLYTLFKGNTTSIRRFKSLTNSVIVFDEIQTVPNKMLWLFNMAINFLNNVCGVTVILCSATQPCLEKVYYPLKNINNLVDVPKKLLDVFKRVNLIDKKRLSLDELSEFVNTQVKLYQSVLVICNTKAEANKLYDRIIPEEGVQKIYLSANLCTEHRKAVIERIRKLLSNKNETKVICISTQVIEAGVDVSFACVIRLQAGMDNIVQASGRCNRHGEIEGLAPVYIVNLKDESLDKLPEIKAAKDATTDLIVEYDNGNCRYTDLMSDDSIEFFYKRLYGKMNKGYQGFCKGGLNLFDLLSCNSKFYEEDDSWSKTCLHQAFKTAGKLFEVFEQQTIDVIVPYGFGKEVIANLYGQKAKYDIAFIKNWIDKSKGYTVSIFNYQLEKLKQNAGVTQVEEFNLYILNSNFYKDDVGLVLESNLMN